MFPSDVITVLPFVSPPTVIWPPTVVLPVISPDKLPITSPSKISAQTTPPTFNLYVLSGAIPIPILLLASFITESPIVPELLVHFVNVPDVPAFNDFE
mgnify:CR=1 FL=1